MISVNQILLGRWKTRGHGLSKTPIYNSWRKMILRCYDPKNKDYERYHSKGIVVCERIRKSPAELAAVIGPRPSKLTLDRINNRGSYTCGSCAECSAKNWPINIRWSDRQTQSLNQDRIRRITIGDLCLCIAEWSRRTSIHYQTLMTRYKKGARGYKLIRQPWK
jgi:hypothetical protein